MKIQQVKLPIESLLKHTIGMMTLNQQQKHMKNYLDLTQETLELRLKYLKFI